MSFQAYLDNIEQKTGKTPNELLALAQAKGFSGDTKAGEIVTWLKDEYDLGRGHAMALVHVIKNGPKISDKHVGSGGAHNDDSDTLRLDGIKNRQEPNYLRRFILIFALSVSIKLSCIHYVLATTHRYKCAQPI